MTDFIKAHKTETKALLANVIKFPLFHHTEQRMSRWLANNTHMELIDAQELVRQLIKDGAFSPKEA